MEKITYKQYQDQRQNEYNELPVFYAFSDDQFAKAMRERGLDPTETDKIYRLGDSGGFYLRSDAEKIRAFFNAPDRLRELMEDPGFAEDAFYYELGNHEYHINTYQGDWDVCSCFGECDFAERKTYRDYLKEIGYPESAVAAFKKARARFLRDAEENNWY